MRCGCVHSRGSPANRQQLPVRCPPTLGHKCYLSSVLDCALLVMLHGAGCCCDGIPPQQDPNTLEQRSLIPMASSRQAGGPLTGGLRAAIEEGAADRDEDAGRQMELAAAMVNRACKAGVAVESCLARDLALARSLVHLRPVSHGNHLNDINAHTRGTRRRQVGVVYCCLSGKGPWFMVTVT